MNYIDDPGDNDHDIGRSQAARGPGVTRTHRRATVAAAAAGEAVPVSEQKHLEGWDMLYNIIFCCIATGLRAERPWPWPGRRTQK